MKEVFSTEDSHIIDLLFARSEQAINALERCFGKQLRQLTANILRDRRDAEEAVSDTYAVWNFIPPQKPSPLAGFVYRIGKNIALKRFLENTAQKRRGNYDLPWRSRKAAFPHLARKTLSPPSIRATDRYGSPP